MDVNIISFNGIVCKEQPFIHNGENVSVSISLLVLAFAQCEPFIKLIYLRNELAKRNIGSTCQFSH